VDLLLCSLFVQASVRRGANLVVTPESDGDLMGDGVNIAARLEGIAEPGE
jgi:class 3 adenylate cyclase